MKKINLSLLIMNFFLVILLFFSFDPFSFFPKSYDDSPLLFPFEIEQINSLQIILETPNESKKMSFKQVENIWYLYGKEGEGTQLASFDSLDKVFNGLKKLHKFEKEKRKLSDAEFWGERHLTISIGDGEGKGREIEFGQCLQLVSECLVREKNSPVAYTIPNSFESQIPELNLTQYQTRSPFAGLSFSQMVKITYFLKGVETYSIYRYGENWKTMPELQGEVEEKSIIDFMTRLRNWSGDEAVDIDTKSKNRLSVKPIQSLAVDYLNALGKTERISLDDIGTLSPGKKLNEVKPFNQYISMPAYNWEYWHFFDIKQLLKKAD